MLLALIEAGDDLGVCDVCVAEFYSGLELTVITRNVRDFPVAGPSVLAPG